jgi:nicotinamidase-related amidase
MSEGWGLNERERSCLVVIDVQQYFLDKLSLDWRAPLVERIAWLMRTAALLDIPVIATAEDVERNGPLVPELIRHLPDSAPAVFNKMVFGLWGQEDIRAAVEATGRDCFVLVGLETDVCVAQSALGLRAAGYRVAVVADACASPPPNHENGLRRLHGSGVVLTSVKTVFYEWLCDLETTYRIREELDVPCPAGLVL